MNLLFNTPPPPQAVPHPTVPASSAYQSPYAMTMIPVPIIQVYTQEPPPRPQNCKPGSRGRGRPQQQRDPPGVCWGCIQPGHNKTVKKIHGKVLSNRGAGSSSSVPKSNTS